MPPDTANRYRSRGPGPAPAPKIDPSRQPIQLRSLRNSIPLLALAALSGCAQLGALRGAADAAGLGGGAADSSTDSSTDSYTADAEYVAGVEAGRDVNIHVTVHPPGTATQDTELEGSGSDGNPRQGIKDRPAGDPPAADPLMAAICDQEGENLTPYDDGTGWHIGCGHLLDRDGVYALALQDRARAEVEAARLLGRARLDAIEPARRDAVYLLCFSAACAGFDATLEAIRAGDWDSAAAEVMDSTFATDPKYPGRRRQAERIAAWLGDGEYSR